ncbi:hypothetical protein CDAR_619201 [Caerostris darwini]|uniref:Beta-ketoacyl synthase N-terminal domain-containing protein n=1 Tax=Caerostris darwini TaxID=1538125 RepID=A0AAV4U2J9_9ARAC|nr:hypothetical protein CDAR_619201 [Caerostris darwini]
MISGTSLRRRRLTEREKWEHFPGLSGPKRSLSCAPVKVHANNLGVLISASAVRGHWISGGAIEVSPVTNYSTTNSFAAAIVAAALLKGEGGICIGGIQRFGGICCHPLLNICIDFDTFLFSYTLPTSPGWRLKCFSRVNRRELLSREDESRLWNVKVLCWVSNRVS